MDFVTAPALRLWNFYQWCLENGDRRVANWPLMQSYGPTWALTALYLLVVWQGPKYMRDRKPVECRTALVVYNFLLVILNGHIVIELLTASYSLNYSYWCQPVSYTEDLNEMRIARALWWYYFSKLVEFLDTFFFIIRKKNNQISFLHVYHHATMFPIWWIGVKWVAGGQAFFGAMINSFIHVLMYGYYGVAALGPQYQKYLWWKRYLTRIQLIQFMLGLIHAVQSEVQGGCGFPHWMHYTLFCYALSHLVLFSNFYYQAYVKRKANSSQEKKEKSQINGHTTNGHSLKQD